MNMKRGFAVLLFLVLFIQLVYSANTSLYVELDDNSEDDFYTSLAKQISIDYDISFESAYEIVLANSIDTSISSEDTLVVDNTTSNSSVLETINQSSNKTSDFVIANTSMIDISDDNVYISLEEFSAKSVSDIVQFSQVVQQPIMIGEPVLFSQNVSVPAQQDSFYFDLQSELLKSNSSALPVYTSAYSTFLYKDGFFVSSGDIWLLDSISDETVYTITYVLPAVMVENDCQESTVNDLLPADAQIVSSDISESEIVSKGCVLTVYQPSDVVYENISFDMYDMYNSSSIFIIERT